MELPHRHIAVERNNDIYCVRLQRSRMNEADILEMAEEVIDLIQKHGCRKMVLSLGPGQIECLYSVFLAKLVMIRRNIVEAGGALKISEATPETIDVFQACHLKELFDFTPDQAAALKAFND